jgi:hypothetical protein
MVRQSKYSGGPHSVPELHATLLRQLGLDHKRVSFRHHGREESLTELPGSAGVACAERQLHGEVEFSGMETATTSLPPGAD